jgi:hypothetical protein
VNAAHDDGYAQTPEVSGHFIGAVRLGGESGNAHKIRPGHGRIVRWPEVLVYDRNFPPRWGQARENHKAERFPYAVAVPAALFDFENAYKRVGWIDQIESHDVPLLLYRDLLLILLSLNAVYGMEFRIVVFLKFRYLDYCKFIRKYKVLIRKRFEL